MGEDGGLNLYGYVGNDPVKWRDPTGKVAIIDDAVEADVALIGYAAIAAGGAYTAYIVAQNSDAITASVIAAIHAHNQANVGESCPAHPIPTPPADPSTSPGPGWEWRGKAGGQIGDGDTGGWYNPGTGESLHPDLNHPDPIGPHWDWKDPSGNQWRIPPGGGSATPK